MEDDFLESIDHRLDILVKLTATHLVQNLTLADGAPLLSACGVDREFIAKIYDTTTESVRVTVATAKKRKNADTTSRKKNNR